MKKTLKIKIGSWGEHKPGLNSGNKEVRKEVSRREGKKVNE